MEQNLYITGDLVYFKGEKAIVEFQNPNTKDSVWVRVIEDSDENRSWNAFLAEIEGIPITPIILEKNKWVKSKQSSKSVLYYKRNFGTNYITFILAEDGIMVCRNGIFLLFMDYVHQLQHLLFGLGINFEIKI